jgi:hypothetical protein
MPPPSLPFLPYSSKAKPFKRATVKLSSSPVTVLQLAEYRRNPRSMIGKQFLRIEPFEPDEDPDDNYDFDDDMWMGPCNELFYKVVGILFHEDGDVVKVIFEGCRIPDERPLAEMLELVGQSELVQG